MRMIVFNSIEFQGQASDAACRPLLARHHTCVSGDQAFPLQIDDIYLYYYNCIY